MEGFKEQVKYQLIRDRSFDFDSEYWTDEELATYQETVEVCEIVSNDYTKGLMLKIKRLEFMIENGLGYEDLKNDLVYPTGE